MVEVEKTVPECIDPAQNSEPVGKRCGARLRGKPGRTCNQFALVGRERCRLHGGSSPRGPAHKSYVHGAYSRELPTGLRRSYERYLNDAELLSARSELAIFRTRMLALSGRLGTNESGAAWGELKALFTAFRAANATGNTPGMVAALTGMSTILEGAVNDEQAFSEFALMAERFTAVAAREARRLVEARLVATVDQVHALVRSITEAIMLHVPDPAARLAIANHIDGLRVLPRAEVDEIERDNHPLVATVIPAMATQGP